ncbi:MAG TPA: chromosome segregation protein SMC [Bauldia sp.]|nr:chromosome segregation protein SMC [Bauldia sp.]
MKFTRLRVLGFKSFVEPTEFLIEAGLTGVVGPNGCGKSNLVEALRWVMGEASYRNMRASGMDDVIFSGSGSRPARNTAEVTLVIDNSDRAAPAAMNDADTLEVTRRIEREAGSVYKINGRDVRARDVQLLFADASTGAHSPAMVGQGKIGELIAAKPRDRRALLEEAAGISGLHNRRHEAELRLSAAEQNLARLDDVIGEIESQLETLKRQARQAVRYRNLSGQIRQAEATVLHLRWLAATAALREAEAALAEATAMAEERAAAQAHAGQEQATAAAALPALRDAAARAGAALQRLVHAREALDAEEARVAERLGDLDRRLAQLADDIAREERMVEDNRTILARLDEEERGIEAANAQMTERQAEAAERRRASESALADSEKSLAELTARLAQISAERTQTERALRDAEGRMARLAEERGKVEAELSGLDTGALAPDRIAALRADAEAAEGAVKAAEAATLAAEERAKLAREKAASGREPFIEAERALNRIEAEAAALVAILGAPRGEGEVPLLDQVKVASGYEAALGAACGDELDAPVDAAAAAFWHRVDPLADDPGLPEGAEAMAAHVQAPPVLARRLAQSGIVPDRETGARLQPLLRPGQRLVTRAGDLWRWDGYVATAESPKPAAQRLANRNRLAELNLEAETARAAAAEKRRLLETAVADARVTEEAERAARDTWRHAQRAFDAARESLAAAEREAARLAARRSALDEANARLATALAEASAARDAASAVLAAAPHPDSFADDLAALRDRVTRDRAALAEARAAVESLAGEAELRTRRLAGIAIERQKWHERGANAEAQIATLTSRRGETEAERTRLADEPARIEAKRRALLTEIEEAETVRAAASDALAVGEAALAHADRAARVALDQLSEAREQRGRQEERVVAARERLAESVQRIDEALGCPPEEAEKIAELKPGAPLPDLHDTEARLERYRQERERLGGVNLRAEEEANETAARRDALVAERDDLVAAIQRLRQGIGSLNREGRERLLAAFGTVNAHFQRLFTHLFGGGEAELQLTESDDPLEAGLEIVARPPGKKPQIMTLLSGGEQALTALSLIFAVFLTNPAPICVLDEVDAPLDDANVERFCNLLDEMVRQTETRFVVITHNPITMSRMNRLFGVTMAERGVSQLVSVDLETAERFREAG